MNYLKIRKDIKLAGKKIFDGGMKVGKDTVSREIKRVKVARRSKNLFADIDF